MNVAVVETTPNEMAELLPEKSISCTNKHDVKLVCLNMEHKLA